MNQRGGRGLYLARRLDGARANSRHDAEACLDASDANVCSSASSVRLLPPLAMCREVVWCGCVGVVPKRTCEQSKMQTEKVRLAGGRKDVQKDATIESEPHRRQE